MAYQLNICLIDDDFLFTESIRLKLLQDAQAGNISVFANGRDALEHLLAALNQPEHQPDVIFLDLDMPVMDGWSFLDAFQELKYLLKRPVRLYLLTGSLADQDLERSQQLEEVVEYVIKPVSSQELVRLITASAA